MIRWTRAVKDVGSHAEPPLQTSKPVRCPNGHRNGITIQLQAFVIWKAFQAAVVVNKDYITRCVYSESDPSVQMSYELKLLAAKQQPCMNSAIVRLPQCRHDMMPISCC